MANVHPFQPYRYSEKAGDLNSLVTQPYDKINPAMQARYLELSPYNLVRVILGERFVADDERDNVYTRASRYFESWIAEGILKKEAEPSLYAYYQEFSAPDSGEKLVRKGFIGLGEVTPYSEHVVHRHEQTLSGPKKDRRQVLEHTRAHFGQIFMLYADVDCCVDSLLDEAATAAPVAEVTEVTDEHGTIHRVYKISGAARIAEIQGLLADKKLLIADGHHRYETALAFREDHPELADAGCVMMTFVNMHSPGLRILATHRVIGGLTDFDLGRLLENVRKDFTVTQVDSIAALKQVFDQPDPQSIRIGVAATGVEGVYLLQRPRNGGLDVKTLHEEILEKAMGITPEAVREERYVKYVRGVEAAADLVKAGAAQVAFLLEATTVQQTADTSFSGGVMPQKSTDFYPKLLTGLTIYKLEK
ncbi:MAG: DUF1015 domain-containing protein [Bryobacteraceae bacterium]